jgi:hypothetical protein
MMISILISRVLLDSAIYMILMSKTHTIRSVQSRTLMHAVT